MNYGTAIKKLNVVKDAYNSYVKDIVVDGKIELLPKIKKLRQYAHRLIMLKQIDPRPYSSMFYKSELKTLIDNYYYG